jgi:hypothetical protein
MRSCLVLFACVAIIYGQQRDTLTDYHAAFYTLGNSYGDHARLDHFHR